METSARRVTVILFDGFELLDVFGPVELFSKVPQVTIDFAGPASGPVRSSQGVRVLAELSHRQVQEPDILLVPGGAGTRPLATDAAFLRSLHQLATSARIATSVCTGSALLAAAGALDGYRATSNKLAFAWASSHGTRVTWVPRARWVQDRDRWTSSGVAAGMDMTNALIEHLFGEDAAAAAARRAEYEPQRDPHTDPFAEIHGLA